MRRVFLIRVKNYKVWYLSDEAVGSFRHIPFSRDKETNYGPLLVAAIPEECKDYDDLEGKTTAEAYEYVKERKSEFTERFGFPYWTGNAIYEGLLRRLQDTYLEEKGYWIIHGDIPEFEDEDEPVA